MPLRDVGHRPQLAAARLPMVFSLLLHILLCRICWEPVLDHFVDFVFYLCLLVLFSNVSMLISAY